MLESISALPILLTVLQSGEGVTDVIIALLIQLAVILFAAKFAGEIAVRYLKLPSVSAEL